MEAKILATVDVLPKGSVSPSPDPTTNDYHDDEDEVDDDAISVASTTNVGVSDLMALQKYLAEVSLELEHEKASREKMSAELSALLEVSVSEL